MITLYKNCKIYDSELKCFVNGAFSVCDGMVHEVFSASLPKFGVYDECIDLDAALVAPGLIDIHTHGRAGGDFISADNAKLSKMSSSYLAHGVTSVMPTLASAPIDEMYNAIDRIKNAENSVFIGVHLEGRYLCEKRRGAHAAHLLKAPDKKEISMLMSEMTKVGYAHVSAALELDTDGEFTKEVLSWGATLGLAHTDATYAEAQMAFDRGASSLTHTYNAMSPFHHRDGGAVGAGLLNDSVFCELICDGFHVSPEAVKLAYKLKKEKILLITDSMEATGMPDGEYSIAGLPVTVKDGKARTHEGAIAGSTLDLLDGVKNLAAFAEISFEEALYCATAAPAKMLGAYDRLGSIEVGKLANIIILDEKHNLSGVIFRGEKQ